MGITKKQIKKVYDIYDEIDKLAEIATQAELEAKKNKDVIATVDGKEVKEQDLWNEFRYLGEKSKAGEYLKDKYKDLFNKLEDYNIKVDELKVYCQSELGVNPLAMTLRDILKLIQAIK